METGARTPLPDEDSFGLSGQRSRPRTSRRTFWTLGSRVPKWRPRPSGSTVGRGWFSLVIGQRGFKCGHAPALTRSWRRRTLRWDSLNRTKRTMPWM